MADTQLPPGWKVLPVTDLFDRLPVGKKYDQWSISPGGKIPILDQSPDGIFGYHDEEPGIDASPEEPVVTFSNHRCYVRLITFPFSTIQNVIPMRCRSGTDPRFFYYAIKNRVPITEYKGHWPEFEILTILLPPIPEQQAIACILGALDDKIELNRQMSRSLEEIARAIFKSWFVDFDPVQAKAEGSDPGLPKHIADLFPDSFQDSELGEIPEGWEVKSIGDLLELAYGKALKASNRRDGSVPVYGSNGQVGWHNKHLVSGPGIVVGRKGNPGIVTWVPIDFFPIDTTFYVVPKMACSFLYFIFHMLQDHDLALIDADSAVPGLNRNHAYMSKQVLPTTPLLEVFEEHTSRLFHQSHHANEQSRTLAALRDTLLPKLISGELRIPDAERIVGRAL